MIYLSTGANGAGKTLLTLRDVRAKSIKENRPVYFNGRFDIVPNGELASWTRVDAKDWQTVPDGAIFVFDECHNDFPVRPNSAPVPPYINALGEHRKRGFDFYLITQHPGNIDVFIRKIIGSPGWHRHLKRASGAPLVSVLSWPAVNDQPQKNGSGKSAEVTMVTYPREVYDWYVSTSLDTAKIKVPFQAKVMIACLLLVPVLGWFGYQRVKAMMGPPAPVSAPAAQGVARPASSSQTAEKRVLNAAEYASSFAPRIEGLAYTAPRYDKQTEPVTAPYPAACIQSASRCECYTQQATKMPVPLALCAQIVKGGFFNDWQQPPASNAMAAAPAPSSAPLSGGSIPEYRPAPVVVAAAAPDPDASIQQFIHRKASH